MLELLGGRFLAWWSAASFDGTLQSLDRRVETIPLYDWESIICSVWITGS